MFPILILVSCLSIAISVLMLGAGMMSDAPSQGADSVKQGSVLFLCAIAVLVAHFAFHLI